MEKTIQNNLEEIYAVEGEVIEQMALAGYDENAQFAVRLAVDEALINAYKHGNREDPARIIRIEAKIAKDEVHIAVEDDGPGFDQHSLLDPTRSDHLRRTSGRGVFLIRQFMTETRFRKNGARVEFTYRRHLEGKNEPYGLAHWMYETATILELNPNRVCEKPIIILESVNRLLDEGSKSILVDMRYLSQIDSAILGSLVSATRETEQRGGCLALVRPQPEIEGIIRATSLDAILRIHDDIQVALDRCDSETATSNRHDSPKI